VARLTLPSNTPARGGKKEGEKNGRPGAQLAKIWPTGHRRKATRRRRAQPWASTRAGEELHGGAISIFFTVARSWAVQAQEEGGEGRKRKRGRGEQPWNSYGGRRPPRSPPPLPFSALREKASREMV